jgi:RNA polymerase sigma-70 factor (ECF subfamily)
MADDGATKFRREGLRQSSTTVAPGGQRKAPPVPDSPDNEADPEDSWPPAGLDAGGLSDLTELLVAAGEGDRDAYCRIFQSVYGKVRGIAAGVLLDDVQAEDVAQEALLEVWLKADRFDSSRGSAETWIFMIARRRAVDRCRQAQAARLRDTRYRHESASPAGVDVAEIVMRRLMFVTAQSKFGVLTPLQREALVLAFFSGHTYTAVAQLLGVPEPTAKTRIRDGLVRLRAALHEAA